MISLLLVVSAGSQELIKTCVEGLDGVRLLWVTYRSEAEIRPAVQKRLSEAHLDCVFFGGPMAFDRCRDLLPETLPVKVVRVGPLDLAMGYLEARRRGLPLSPVSIDTFDQGMVRDFNARTGIALDDYSCLPYASDCPLESIVEHHLRFLDRSGGYVITGRSGVADRMPDRNSVITVVADPFTITAVLYELALSVRAGRSDPTRFAAANFAIVNRDRGIDMHSLRRRLSDCLHSLPEFSDAWITSHGTRGVVVIADASLLEEATGGWTHVPAIESLASELDVKIAAGFGMASTARSSVRLAERAAARSADDRESGGYLVSANGLMIGPMSQGNRRRLFRYRDHSRALEELASSVHLSPSTLSRIADLERELESNPISAVELADALGVRDTSARRVIRTLVAGGLVESAGRLHNSGRGRPTLLYRLVIRRNVPDHAFDEVFMDRSGGERSA